MGSMLSPNGSSLFVFRYDRSTWALGILKDGWKFADRAKVPVRVFIDDGNSYSGNAIGTTEGLLYIVPAPGMEDSFRMGNVLQVRGANISLSFDLAGTNKLMAALSDCVARYSADPRYADTRENREVRPSGSTAPAAKEAPRKGVSTGTGFVLNAAGYVVTNNHVVKECTDIRLQRPGDLEVEGKLVVVDRQNDLALLKAVSPLGGDTAKLANSRAIQPGEKIAVYGFPLSGALSTSGNIVSGNVSALAGLANNASLFQISAPIQPGNSGGPLLNFRGDVIGVVNAKLDEIVVAEAIGTLPQNVNFAIKSNVLTNFLDANSVQYDQVESSVDLELTGVAAKAQRFTLLVTCRG
jgi:S1-C subfamily serine protease